MQICTNQNNTPTVYIGTYKHLQIQTRMTFQQLNKRTNISMQICMDQNNTPTVHLCTYKHIPLQTKVTFQQTNKHTDKLSQMQTNKQ